VPTIIITFIKIRTDRKERLLLTAVRKIKKCLTKIKNCLLFLSINDYRHTHIILTHACALVHSIITLEWHIKENNNNNNKC